MCCDAHTDCGDGLRAPHGLRRPHVWVATANGYGDSDLVGCDSMSSGGPRGCGGSSRRITCGRRSSVGCGDSGRRGLGSVGLRGSERPSETSRGSASLHACGFECVRAHSPLTRHDEAGGVGKRPPRSRPVGRLGRCSVVRGVGPSGGPSGGRSGGRAIVRSVVWVGHLVRRVVGRSGGRLGLRECAEPKILPHTRTCRPSDNKLFVATLGAPWSIPRLHPGRHRVRRGSRRSARRVDHERW